MAYRLTETQVRAFQVWGWSRERIAEFVARQERAEAERRRLAGEQAAITRVIAERGRKITRPAANV